MNEGGITKCHPHEIAFLHKDNKLMVNATQMAKIFEKRVEDFTRIESTQYYMDEC